ncbi:hypothetical protein BV20DRAFT_969103 [Pilatotrama ljubarskyi]|nr:hypothetical protein BV20DRAFT_969103 [Pilatotrama ljubarskyi]
MPQANDTHSTASSGTRASSTTHISQSTPATTPDTTPIPLPPGQPLFAGNFLDMTQTPESSTSGGSNRSSMGAIPAIGAAGASSPRASVHSGSVGPGSPVVSVGSGAGRGAAASPGSSVVSYGSVPGSPPSAVGGPGVAQASPVHAGIPFRPEPYAGGMNPGGHTTGSVSSTGQSSASSPVLSPGINYYNPQYSGQQSPALPSSGIPSCHLSPSGGAYQPTSPLARSDLASSNQDPAQAQMGSRYPVRGTANPSNVQSTSRAQGSSSQASGVISPFSLDPSQRSPGNQNPTGAVATNFPQGGYQPFAGAFQSNPQHSRTGSSPIPRPSPPQYNLGTRPLSGEQGLSQQRK